MALAEHRRKIEEIDEKIIKLIDQRIDVSKKIFEAKRSERKPISDPERERQILKRPWTWRRSATWTQEQSGISLRF